MCVNAKICCLKTTDLRDFTPFLWRPTQRRAGRAGNDPKKAFPPPQPQYTLHGLLPASSPDFPFLRAFPLENLQF